ncbi:MAG TPA: ABC transporter substrate-binding protein [Alphaproteobacteria bacterium]
MSSRLFHAFGALVFLLAGASAAWSQDKKPTPLNVGTLKIASQTDVHVAKQRGMFERNGIDAKIIQFQTGGHAINAAQAGEVDVLLSIVGIAMIAIERGFDLVALFQDEVAKKAPPDSGSVQVPVNSSVKTLAGLAGKKIAVGGLHTQNTVALQMLLKRAGVDLKTIQFVEIPFPAQVPVLKSGQVDAVATLDPFTTQLQSTGVGRVISWNYVEAIPEMPLGVWFTKSASIKKNPEVYAAFNRSIKESLDYLNADAERARREVAEYTGLDPALIKNMPLSGWDYKVRPDKWQAVIDMLVDNGELARPHKAAEYFSPQIEPYIAK